jgi:hypothetical protein
MRRPSSLLAVLVLFATSVASPAAAQEQARPTADEIRQLRGELAELRAELLALKALVAARGPADVAPPSATSPASPQDPQITMLQTQVAELAQSKVESERKFPLRIFGTIHTHMFANSGEPNWLDIPNLIQPPPSDGYTGTFSATLRQTRIGLAADGPTIGGARTSGLVAMDFLGGIPGFVTGQTMPLPRLLVGYARIETDRFALQAGQDHAILAPRDPSSLAAFAFPLLFRSGNLYLRAPQARVEAALSSQVRLSAGILAPVGGDVPGENYRFVPPALGGERSRHPAAQARLEYASLPAVDAPRRAAFGVSGHFGRERRAGVLDEGWAGAFDFAVRRDWIGAAGEAFSGRNIDAFGGGTGQDVRSQGGWAELQLFPTTRLAAAGGFGTDRVRGTAAGLPRRANENFYGNIRFALTPEIEASFEYMRLKTTPGNGASRRNNHFDWVLVYRF